MRNAYTIGPAGSQPIPIEWTRPARAWLPSGLIAEAMKANERADAAPAGTPIMRLWPREAFLTTDGIIQAEAVGPCPFCDMLHQHGISKNPVRRMHRCVSLWSGFLTDRPDEVLVRFELDEPMPEDLVFKLSVRRPDLLTLADVAARHIHHRLLKRLHRRKRVTGAKYQGPGPWKRHHTHFACRRMIETGIFDEAIGRLIEGGMTKLEAERICVARFIRARKGRDGIERMHAGLLWAYRQAGRGSTNE